MAKTLETTDETWYLVLKSRIDREYRQDGLELFISLPVSLLRIFERDFVPEKYSYTFRRGKI